MTTRPIVVGAPDVRVDADGADVRYPIDGLPHDALWFRVSPEAADFVAEACDAALATLLPAAMLAGRPLHLDGPVSTGLLWGVRHVAMPVLRRQLPFLSSIPVVASSSFETTGSRAEPSSALRPVASTRSPRSRTTSSTPSCPRAIG